MFGVGLLLLTSKSRAELGDDADRQAARALGYAGVEAYQAGDYAKANDKLARAFELLRAPSLGLWSARALVRTGDLMAALARYREVVTLPIGTGNADIQNQARIDAQRELSELSLRVPRIRLSTDAARPEHVDVWLDESKLSPGFLSRSIELNPGEHRIRARSEGRQIEIYFSVAERQNRAVTLRFGTATSARRSLHSVDTVNAVDASTSADDESVKTRRILGWVAVGTGGAGLLVGAVTGALAMDKKSELDDSPACDNRGCLPSERERVESYDTLRWASSAGFITGAALGAVGVTLLLLPTRSENEKAKARPVSLSLLPAGAAVRGSF